MLSSVYFFVTPWTVPHQAPLSTEFSRQEYGSGEPFLSPGDLTNLGIEPGLLALQAEVLPSEPRGKPKINANNIFFGIFILNLYVYQHKIYKISHITYCITYIS